MILHLQRDYSEEVGRRIHVGHLQVSKKFGELFLLHFSSIPAETNEPMNRVNY